MSAPPSAPRPRCVTAPSRSSSLASHQVVAPTLVFARGEELAFGSSAAVRGQGEPAGLSREFKRRVGDSVADLPGRRAVPADRLVALFAALGRRHRQPRSSVSRPPRIAVTHPANWTEFQLDLLATAARRGRAGRRRLLSGARAAAAIDFAAVAEHRDRRAARSCTTSAAARSTSRCCASTDDGLRARRSSRPGIERLGGIDFDEAVFEHVAARGSRQTSSRRPRRPRRVAPALAAAARGVRRGQGGAVAARSPSTSRCCCPDCTTDRSASPGPSSRT